MQQLLLEEILKLLMTRKFEINQILVQLKGAIVQLEQSLLVVMEKVS